MKNISIKKAIVTIILVLLITITIPNFVSAANENVAILKVNDDYVIYLKDKENETFEFAFTNKKNLTESEISSELNFIQNWDDSDKNSIACLEKTANVDFTKTIYMWIKDKDSKTFSIELNLKNVLSQTEMASIENLTQTIETNSKNTVTKTVEEDGVKKTTTIGQLQITDSSDSKYKYQMIKLDGTESNEVKTLNSLLDELKTKYTNMTMYNKILFANKVRDAYVQVFTKAKLTDVVDMVINQPEESENGDKYLVLLQKVSGEVVQKSDVKYLNCTKNLTTEKQKETKVIKTTSKLPVTYDSIFLIILLVVIVVAVIAVIVRMRKLNEKE